MIRHKILDVCVKEDNPASQEVFRWFKYSIAEVIDMIIKDFYPNHNKDKWLN